MTRLARMVIPGLLHHVTQRGNRREAIFFEAGDQEVYRDLLAEQARKAGIEVWAHCLMPNHGHLILRPDQVDRLGRAELNTATCHRI
jgi:putative transposase